MTAGIFGGDEEPGRTRVKICGITNEIDAVAAVEAGADALGFNGWTGSPRYIDIYSARDWLENLPGDIAKIAVLVNPTLAEAAAIFELPFIDALQLHGDESPEFCQALADRSIRFIKAVGVKSETSLRDLPFFFTQTILLDSRSPAGFGGTGQTFPWILAKQFVETHRGFEVVLAGGLTPENVAEAVEQVQPFAVDVTSGVESSPGRKNPARLREFMAAARPFQR